MTQEKSVKTGNGPANDPELSETLSETGNSGQKYTGESEKENMSNLVALIKNQDKIIAEQAAALLQLNEKIEAVSDKSRLDFYDKKITDKEKKWKFKEYRLGTLPGKNIGDPARIIKSWSNLLEDRLEGKARMVQGNKYKTETVIKTKYEFFNADPEIMDYCEVMQRMNTLKVILVKVSQELQEDGNEITVLTVKDDTGEIYNVDIRFINPV